jgi:hypothetical protein
MEEPLLITYQLKTKDKGYDILSPDGKKTFVHPSTARGPKIYIIRLKHVFFYVGKTIQPMSQRFGFGFKPKRKGEYGYKWRFEEQPLSVDVWHFSKKISDRDLETIEAEIVYRFRSHAGYWPIQQNEIHFFDFNQNHSITADIIFSTSHTNKSNPSQVILPTPLRSVANDRRSV